MPSTFFGLTISASGLNTANAQINTTANNISNVNTDGYSKQVVNTVASSALRCYMSYGTTGTGVEATGVSQCRDQYYDEKYWNNQSDLGYYDKKYYYMNQVENYFNETNKTDGFTSIYTKMFNAMSTLQSNAGDNSVRKQFIADAKELCNYFNDLSTKLKDLQSSINDEIKTAVDEINAIAEKIAILNKQINVIEQGGGTANELRDQRALLLDELSTYTSIETNEVEVKNSNYPDMNTGATYFTVKINGQVLVDTYEYNSLSVVSRDSDAAYNQCDVDGLYKIIWEEDGNEFNPCTAYNTGSLKAMFEVRDGNNNENMTGVVYSSDSTSITIEELSVTSINELNMPAAGSITVNNKSYKYDSFEVTTDENGTITSVKFNLDASNPLDADAIGKIAYKSLTVGSSVDFMGIPYYQNQMNLFLRNFCEQFNLLEESGVTLDGDEMGAFFIANSVTDTTEYAMSEEGDTASTTFTSDLTSEDISYNFYYLLTAGNVGINTKSDKDSSYFATTAYADYGQDAADIVESLQELQNDLKIFRGGSGSEFLQCIYADVTVDTQECSIFVENFTNIQSSIENQRLSVSGVDEDEEALDLIKFQNAYNLASKCISIFSEIYDRLILETGV